MDIQVYVDGVTYTHNEDSITQLIKDKKRLEADLVTALDDSLAAAQQIRKLRTEVYEFFSSRYEAGDEDITCYRTDVNELLSMIGADLLASKWNMDVTITVSLTGVEAATEEEAMEKAENEINVEFYGDGDVFVEDITVNHISAD